MMQLNTVLIAGGTGLLGVRLAWLLAVNGFTVRLLSRNPKTSDQFAWNPAKMEMDIKALEGVDVVINLAGSGIADKRWTSSRKKELIESRVNSAALLFREIEKMPQRPQVYLSASAVGYYGNSGEQWMLEGQAPVDHSFMVDCCQQWETAARQMETLGLRTAIFRIGVVLAKEGGALKEVVKPLRFGLGAYFGNGKAWWPWIHRDDVCRAFVWAIENQLITGTYNLVSPNPVRGRELVVSTAKAMDQWALFVPAPAFVLRLILGEMSAVILNSNRVSAEKLSLAGFEFNWPVLDNALRDIFAAQKHH